MSAPAASGDPVYSDECGMQDLATNLKIQICSYLEVHEQLAMRKVSKWWRGNLSQVCLSQYVDMDASKIEKPGNKEKNPVEELSGENDQVDPLEHALNIHVQKNTMILILRHVEFNKNKFDLVTRVIKAKGTGLIQLILKNCELQEEYTSVDYWWLHPQRIALKMLDGLISITKKLIVDNFTIRNLVSGAVMSSHDIVMFNMPSYETIQKRLAAGNMYKKLPIVLPRWEVDCSVSVENQEGRVELLRAVYRSFIMAVDAQCPPVSPEMREDLGKLCRVWTDCHAVHVQHEWVILRALLKCLNEGFLLTTQDATVDIEALRNLDPLTFNRLTSHVLHRIYCLPTDGTVYTPAADSGHDPNVTYME